VGSRERALIGKTLLPAASDAVWHTTCCRLGHHLLLRLLLFDIHAAVAAAAVAAAAGQKSGWVRALKPEDAIAAAAWTGCWGLDPLLLLLILNSILLLLLTTPAAAAAAAGQKSGWVWALKPEDGSVDWSLQVGPGGLVGGLQWGR
jgi:hypothetical protein